MTNSATLMPCPCPDCNGLGYKSHVEIRESKIALAAILVSDGICLTCAGLGWIAVRPVWDVYRKGRMAQLVLPDGRTIAEWAIPNDSELELDAIIAQNINMGYMEAVDMPYGSTSFRLTEKGKQYVEKNLLTKSRK